jgi:cytochrome P450
VREKYDLPPVFYLDLEPVDRSILVILDPQAAEEVSQNSNLPKHEQVRNVLEPLMGPQNLLTTDGALWKKWRTIFNPGFSVQHLMTQVRTTDPTLNYA